MWAITTLKVTKLNPVGLTTRSVSPYLPKTLDRNSYGALYGMQTQLGLLRREEHRHRNRPSGNELPSAFLVTYSVIFEALVPLHDGSEWGGRPWQTACLQVRSFTFLGLFWRGLFTILNQNPQGMIPDFGFLVVAFIKYQRPDKPTKQAFVMCLKFYKKNVGDEKWEKFLKSLPEYVKSGMIK